MLRRVASSNRIAFSVNGSSIANAVAPAAQTDGAWHHYAGTWDGATVRLYVDGVEVASAAQTTMRTDDEVVCIGSLAANATTCGGATNRPWSGDIDDVSLWNRALSAAEIQAAIQAELAGTESGLVAYWRMNENAGQTIGDSGPSALNGVLGATAAVESNDPAWLSALPPQ
jgi:hypothetical protein